MGKEATLSALDAMVEEKMAHFNQPCPHCGKINKISRQELMRAAPEWANKPQGEKQE
jgi:predicted RNA-binding Zn-ribbon protein involved in translation (DUF1610 family)